MNTNKEGNIYGKPYKSIPGRDCKKSSISPERVGNSRSTTTTAWSNKTNKQTNTDRLWWYNKVHRRDAPVWSAMVVSSLIPYLPSLSCFSSPPSSTHWQSWSIGGAWDGPNLLLLRPTVAAITLVWQHPAQLERGYQRVCVEEEYWGLVSAPLVI